MTATSGLALRRAAVRSAGRPGGRTGENHDRAVGDPVRGLLLVADGMGGLPLASVSADRAAAVVGQFLDAGSDGQALHAAVLAAGSAVANMARTAGVRRAGTTLCVGLVQNDRLLVANLGDSRCYLARGGAVRVLTVDHTPAARLVGDGTIEAGSRAAADLSRSLDRYLGGEDCAPDLASHEIRPGDRLLLCTDGVHRELSSDNLMEILLRSGRPAEAAERLIEAAMEAGSRDDATAVVADVGVRPTGALSVTSLVGGALLAPGEIATVGRAGQGADVGFDDSAVHAQAARLITDDKGWVFENTGRKLEAIVRDRCSRMTIDVPCFRSLRVPFSHAEVIFTTRHFEHTIVAECPAIVDGEVIVPTVSKSGTDDAYPMDRTTAQFRTLVAVCEPLLRRHRWGWRSSYKSILRRLRPVEPDVTLKAVARRIDELSDKILGPGVRDLRELADRAIITGTVIPGDLSLLERRGSAPK